mmetsp:Transcript_45468/g.95310  ORF Transcript_45468/g.95310 Transcript_45468/m.95310 type:complete len:88 (+) Transcript_45468:204-467(+)
MTCSIRSHSISADCLKRIEFDDFIRQYFNKEEHTKLDALAKKLRRHIQPTQEEHEADIKSLQKLLAHHKITASKNALDDLMKWRFGS